MDFTTGEYIPVTCTMQTSTMNPPKATKSNNKNKKDGRRNAATSKITTTISDIATPLRERSHVLSFYTFSMIIHLYFYLSYFLSSQLTFVIRIQKISRKVSSLKLMDVGPEKISCAYIFSSG